MAVKLTVNLSDEVASALKAMACEDGVTITEQLARAISTEKWLHDVRRRRGRVLVDDPDKGIREVVFAR